MRNYSIKLQAFKEKIVNLPFPIKTSITYTICSLFQKGIAFIAVPIYTRLVVSNQYGVYSLYQSWESVLSIFATLNLWTYCFSRGILKFEKDKDKFISALVGLSFVLTSIVAIFIITFVKQFSAISSLTIGIIVLMLADFYLRPSYEFWCARQRFEYDVKKYVISAIFISLLTPFISVFLIMFSKAVEYKELGNVLIVGKNFIPMIVYFCILMGIVLKRKPLYEKHIWIYALKFNLPLIPHFLSVVILAQSDRIMIGKMCGTSEAAIYSIAYSVASIMLIINNALMDSIIPWTYNKIRSGEISKLPSVSLMALWVILAINAFVSMFAPEIIYLMAPDEYYTAVYIVPPVAMSNVFIFMFNLYANIEYYYEETKLVAVASCFSAITNIILNWIFIQKYGFIAAGYTTLACYVIYAVCHFAFMKYVLRKHATVRSVYNEIALWMTGLIGILLTLATLFLYRSLIIRILLSIVIILILFTYRSRLLATLQTVRKMED